MIERLFKGKRKDNGEWIEGWYAPLVCNDKTIIPCIRNKNGTDKEVIPETVGQYTGLTDKNGKKIFEGDIVKTKFGRLCIVVWFSSPEYNGWDLIVYNRADVIFTKAPDKFDIYDKCNLEVIGNIHDNPELLEE